MILLLGNSDLAHEIQRQLQEFSVIVGRPDYDFSCQESCNRVIQNYQPDVVINTMALNEHHNPWSVLTVNFVSVAYITLGFYDKMTQGHIINISSTSTYWVSYPGIPTGRLVYNISKDSLSQFGKYFNRKIVDQDHNVAVSTIELGAFPSRFNNHQGQMTLQRAAEVVVDCIYKPRTAISIIK